VAGLHSWVKWAVADFGYPGVVVTVVSQFIGPDEQLNDVIDRLLELRWAFRLGLSLLHGLVVELLGNTAEMTGSTVEKRLNVVVPKGWLTLVQPADDVCVAVL
jgi:hypothetical protein